MSPDVSNVDKVVHVLETELGSWTLGQLSRQGLADAIWDAYSEFQQMTDHERDVFTQQVYETIYG